MKITDKIDKYLNEGKNKVKYKIDSDMEIIAVGDDNNGKYSYWLNVTGKKRPVKVPHGGFKNAKIMRYDIKHGSVDKRTIEEIKEYIKKY